MENKTSYNEDNLPNNEFSLKEENKDNLIEKNTNEEQDPLIIENKFSDTLKYKLKYAEIIKAVLNRDDVKYLSDNEFYCNILLMTPNKDFTDIISCLSLISYCYQSRESFENTYLMANKFEKNINSLKSVDQSFFLKVFCRAAYFFQKEENFFYAYKYIIKCDNLIKNNQTIGKKAKGDIKDYYEKMEKDFEDYLKKKERQFFDENDEDAFTKKNCKKILNLMDSIISYEYNNNNQDIEKNNDNYMYVINKQWAVKVKTFIEPYLANFTDKKNFIKKAFEPKSVYDYYFDEKEKQSSLFIYPGPINNFPLISFKDCWEDSANPDENIFLKKDIRINEDYALINSKDWSFLKEMFDCTNEIKRKVNNINLKKIKFLLLDKRISKRNETHYLLKQKYLQINQNSTIKQLKMKILSCVNNIFKLFNKKSKQNVCFYILSKDKKELLIEICYAFINGIPMYESLYIENIEFNDDNTLDDFFLQYDKSKHILIVEITNKNDLNFLVQINNKNNYKCSICNNTIVYINKKYNCDICHYSLFCSRKCAYRSNEHISLDELLNKIMEPKFNLSDLFSLELSSLISRDRNIGRIILKNLGNTSYMNSTLNCLSNTLDLTKYFLKNYFKNEINNANYYGSKGQMSQAYFDLINKLWNGRNEEINPKDFRIAFCNLNKAFINPEYEQDPYEFMTFLLDNLHEDLNRISNKRYQILEEKKEDENDEQASNRWWEYYNNRDNSIITDLFRGQYKTTIKCLCGNTSVKYDTYMSLGLPIPSKKNYISIKLFINNGNYIDLNVKANEKTEIKDIILDSINYLDKTKYFDNAKQIDNKNDLFNYNITDTPVNLLYNNIQVIELNKEHKLLNVYNTSFENINDKNPKLDDHLKYIELCEEKNNSEFILLEKDINSNLPDYVDVYAYPAAEIEKEGYLSLSFSIVFKILSYPIIFSINKNDNIKALQTKIVQKFQKIFENQYRGANSIEICFPHFNDKWGYTKIKQCPLCLKSYDRNSKYCNLSDSVRNNNIKISKLIKHLDDNINNKNIKIPLIFYAKSNCYNNQSRLYKGMDLFFDKKNEIEIESKKHLSLLDSLELFNKEELLDGENMLYCNKCKSKQKSTKKIELYRTPKYLIIQLKRFKQKKNSSLANKNDTFIEYKEVLNLKDFVVGPDKDKSIYDLYGVVIHKKYFNTNNFISYCKNFGYWFSYDDNSFNVVENPINKDAYLLFYKKTNFD